MRAAAGPAVLLAALWSTAPDAQWSTRSDAELCATGSGSASLDVQFCSRAIQDAELRKVAGATLATLYSQRGQARYLLGEPVQAIRDHTLALRHNAFSAAALRGRAVARHALGMFGAALDDFDDAISLSPTYAAAWRDRAVTRAHLRQFDAAVRDLQRASVLNPWDAEPFVWLGLIDMMLGEPRSALRSFNVANEMGFSWPYLPIWRFLACDCGERGRAALLRDIELLRPDEWPQPLLRAFTGDASPAQVVAHLQSDPERAGLIGAAHFYLSQLPDQTGAAAHGHTSLQIALEQLPQSSVEYLMASEQRRVAIEY